MRNMDGAARGVEKVAQRDLPDRPHHLCIDHHRKYPDPPGFWYSGESARLQYMTYLSDADRGILLTLPFFEIRDEPDTPKPLKIAARGEAKKKMSFKDYQNMKKSASPADRDPPVKPRPQTQNGRHTDPPPPPLPAIDRESRREGESRDLHDRNEGSRVEKPRQQANGEVDPPPTSKPFKNGEPIESRKRKSDWQDDSPTQKKIKSETSASNRDSSLSRSSEKEARGDPRTDSSRMVGEKGPRGDAKHRPSHLGANGQARKGAEKNRLSPAPAAHVNGVRAHSRSVTPTPTKAEASAKQPVPELLSPLRLGLDEDTESSRAAARKSRERESGGRGHSRENSGSKVPELLSPLRLGLDADRNNTASSKRSERLERPQERGGKGTKREEKSPARKPKPLPKIPPLLSPTLPAVVEAELTRIKKTSSKGDRSQDESRSSESPLATVRAKGPFEGAGAGSGANTNTNTNTNTNANTNANAGPKRRSRIVVLKYKKRNARTVSAILALPSKSHKEALKKDRPISQERTPPHAKKRPPPADERASEAAKKARTAVPSTPLKNTSTAMSRVASNTSQAQTPSHSTGLTPVVADRPPTSSGPLDPAKAATYRQRHMEYIAVGSKLKHTRDDMVRHGKLTPAEDKRIGALSLEMILAYMVSFDSLKQARLHENKVLDLQNWETLLPHFGELVRRRPPRPLRALALQMNAICLEEITRAYTSLDPGAATYAYGKWVKMEKKRPRVWADAASVLDEVPDGRLKAGLGPWSSVESAVAAALAIMREWADKEGVSWKTEISLPGTGKS